MGTWGEDGAFRGVVAVLVACGALVATATVAGPAAGLSTSGLLAACSLAWALNRQRDPHLPTLVPVRSGADGERLIVVVANEVLDCDALVDDIRRCCGEDRERVLVVCPALNSRLRHWVSDEDAARAAARERLDVMVSQLEQLGIDARGQVGDADPAQALDDALRTFGADTVLLSKGATDQSHWLARRLLEQAPDRLPALLTYRNEPSAAEPVPAAPAALPLGDAVAVTAAQSEPPPGPTTLN